MNSSILNHRKPTLEATSRGTLLDAGGGRPVGPAAPDEVRAGPSRQPVQWGLVRRISFRFACVYLFLYMIPFLLGHVIRHWPSFWEIVQPYFDGWRTLVAWMAEHVFQVELKLSRLGSGDRTDNYIQLFCYLVLAAAAAAVWSLIDRKRTNYARLWEWLRVYVRFFVAAEMIVYGAVKVIKVQFGEPPLHQLGASLGEHTPMGLLWTFLGASTPYTIFSGAAEMLAGLLLLFRRTTLLGAVVCIGVMANVVMLNFSYDVCVKLHSSHLLALAFLLAAPDLGRLVRFFVLNRATPPAEHRPVFRRPWLRRGAVVLMTVLCLGFTIVELRDAHEIRETYGDNAPKPPLYGIWNVQTFAVDGALQPLLITDAKCWRRVCIDRPGFFVGKQGTLTIQYMNDRCPLYGLEIDTAQRIVVLSSPGDPDWTATFTYSEPAAGLLVLSGTLNGRQIQATLQRFDHSQLPINRGFHWISD
jgi:hypothetical protein